MNIVGYKILFAFILFFVAFAGGLAPIILSSFSISGRIISVGNAFAGGVLLAAAVVHLLPDAVDALTDLGTSIESGLQRGSTDVFPIANVIAIVAFLLLMLLDSWLTALLGKSHGHGHGHGDVDGADDLPQQSLNIGEPLAGAVTSDTRSFGAQPFLIALGIHSVIEGMSVGASSKVASLIGIFIAIAAHKGMAGFALTSELRKTLTKKTTCYCVFIFAICSPVGIVIGSVADSVLSGTGVGVLIAIASGTFLFVAVPDLVIPALERSDCRGSVCCALLIGVLGMSLLAAWT